MSETAAKTPEAPEAEKPTLTADQALGSHYQVFYKGRMWKLSPFTEGVKSDFIAHLKAVARAEVFSLEGLLPPDKWQLCFREYMRQLSAGSFNWLGDVCVPNMQSPEGIANILALMLAYAGENAAGVTLTQTALLEMAGTPAIKAIVWQAIQDALPKVEAPKKPEAGPTQPPADPQA